MSKIKLKKICVLTANRSEYSLLKPLIKKLSKKKEFNVCVAVTGAHLSPEFGMTYCEIEKDGIRIDKKIEILLSADSPSAVSKSMGLAMIGFAEYFEENKPDILIVLGDRYETLAVCCAAVNQGIPIAHIHGGEVTEGAIDDGIRHAITKLSYLHFTSTIEYQKRVIQLGEHPERVFCVGALGVENVLNMPLISKKQLEESINFALDKPYGMVTFHPVTLEHGNAEMQVGELLGALDLFTSMKFIITKANADAEGRVINKYLEEYEKKHENVKLFDSLGTVRYLSAVKYSSMVIGNSSSGLIEAPSFRIPTINIGNRQKGRMQAASIINCKPESCEIATAIKRACTYEFQEKLEKIRNPYGNGETSDKIADIIFRYLFLETINLCKPFYDI